MTFTIIFLLSSFLTGYLATFFLSKKFIFEERLFLSLPGGFFINCLLIFLVAHFFGLTKEAILLSSLFSLLSLLLLKTKYFPDNKKASHFKIKKELLISFLIIAAIFLPVVFWLFDRTMLKVKPGGWYTSYNNYGDLPWHMLFAGSFAYGNNFPPVHPIFPPNHLSFHFFIDFLSSIFLVLSDSFRLAFLIPGLILTISIIFLSFLLVSRLVRCLPIAFLTIFIFFFHGNLGLFDFLKKFFSSKLSLINFLNLAASNYLDFNKTLCNFLGAYLVAQRAYLFGFNIFLLVVFLLFFTFSAKKKSRKKSLLAKIAFIIGLSFFFDAHATLSLIIILLTLSLTSLLIKKERLNFSVWLLPAIIIITLLAGQFLWVLPNISLTGSFVQFKPFWQAEGFLNFWWQNLGFLIPFGFLGFIVCKKINRSTKILAFSTIPIFAIFNLVLLAPHHGDNNRIIYYPLFFLALGSAGFLYSLFKKSSFFTPLIVLFLIFLTGGGIVSIYTRNQNLFQLFSDKDLQNAIQVREKTPPQATILSAPIFNQPINAIAGRRIFLGWEGYITTQGFPFNERFQIIKKIYAGDKETKSLIKQNKIDFIFIGPLEKNDFLVNEEFFRNNFQAVWQSENSILYSAN